MSIGAGERPGADLDQCRVVRRDGLLVGKSRSGMVAGHLQVGHRPRRLTGGGVVVPQDAGHFLQAVCGGLLKAQSRLDMQPAALGFHDALIGRLLDQGVAEAVGGSGLLAQPR